MITATDICKLCKKSFTYEYHWFLTRRKKCDSCCINHPRTYSKPIDTND